MTPTLDLIAHDVACLRGIPHAQALAALERCLAGDNQPLRRMGYAVTAEMSSGEAMRIVTEYSAGQAEAWLQTADAARKSVRA